MPRHHLRSKLSGAELSVGEVWDWYEFQLTLINAERIRVLDALVTGANLDQPRYFGRTRDELIEFFGEQRAELDNAAMLSLLAATEAALRVDFIVRVMNKKKDPISKGFNGLYRQDGLKVGLEQILDLWKQLSGREIHEFIGDFNGALNLRHWLAHGRYWKPRLGQTYDTQDVFTICNRLLHAIAAER